MPLQDTTFADARWITPQGAKTSIDGNRSAFFRLQFTLPDPLPKSARFNMAITAHTRYKLRINGQPIAVGPRKGDEHQKFYEKPLIDHVLVPGENTVLIQVVSYAPQSNPDNMGYGPISVWTLPLEPALLVAGGVMIDDVLSFDATTGSADWRAVNGDMIEWVRFPQTHYVGAMERWHALRMPEGLTDPQAAWPEALTRWDPNMNAFGEMPSMVLCERTIPLMEEEEQSFAAQMPCVDQLHLTSLDQGVQTDVPENSTLAVELDAGVFTTGYFCMDLSGGAGSTLRIRYAECYRPKDEQGNRVKRVRDQPCEGGLEDAYDELLLSGQPLSFESFWFRTFRFVRIEIETAGEPLTLRAPWYRRTSYPLTVRAKVKSSSPWVEKLFDISVRTLRCCMHETYEDCPYYEQLQYISDTKLQMDFTYAISGDLRMARQVIDDYHRSMLADGMLQSRAPSQHRQAIPQFALYWIHMLYNLYEQDGDFSFVSRYRTTIDAVLEYFNRHRDSRGLVTDLGYWDFADWVPQWEHGRPTAIEHGPSTIHNMAYAWTLQIANELMNIAGHPGLAQDYLWRSYEVIAAVRNHCFDREAGLFREGPSYGAFSEHAQVFAVLCGALEGDEAVLALEQVVGRADVFKCSYPQQFYLLRALEKVGRYDLSESVWKNLINLLPLNITTLPETPGESRSDCHAWSALPLYDAPRVWLGVRPTAPGWRGITVKPHFDMMLGDLSGTAPTPHGPVAVAWESVEGGVKFSVDSPYGVELTVMLPNGSIRKLPRGGEVDMLVTK